MLAMRSIETKLVMHWIKGDCCLVEERCVHAVEGHVLVSSSMDVGMRWVKLRSRLSFFSSSGFSCPSVVF